MPTPLEALSDLKTRRFGDRKLTATEEVAYQNAEWLLTRLSESLSIARATLGGKGYQLELAGQSHFLLIRQEAGVLKLEANGTIKSAMARSRELRQPGVGTQPCAPSMSRGFCEVHHLEPLSSLSPEGTTYEPADLAILCPNCHRMAHRRPEMIPLDELRALRRPLRATASDAGI